MVLNITRQQQRKVLEFAVQHRKKDKVQVVQMLHFNLGHCNYWEKDKILHVTFHVIIWSDIFRRNRAVCTAKDQIIPCMKIPCVLSLWTYKANWNDLYFVMYILLFNWVIIDCLFPFFVSLEHFARLFHHNSHAAKAFRNHLVLKCLTFEHRCLSGHIPDENCSFPILGLVKQCWLVISNYLKDFVWNTNSTLILPATLWTSVFVCVRVHLFAFNWHCNALQRT